MENIKISNEVIAYTVEMRRGFHELPEPGFGEVETQKKIISELEKMNIPYKKIAGTGVVGIIEGHRPGKTVALRADIDALEITELSDIAYKSSVDGMMHACGHDGHAAMLLAAAGVLNDHKDSFSGKIKLLFQPAEESLRGAKKMIKEGALEGVDAIYGQHLWNNMPTGTVNVESGPRMASGDPVTVIFTGKGGHASMPNQTIDPIVVASSFILNANSISSREKSPMEPMVFTMGKMASGTRFNIIPEVATLQGTIRCFSEETRQNVHNQVKRYAESAAMMYGAKAEVIIGEGTPTTVNDPIISEIAKEVAVSIVGKEQVIEIGKVTGSEDMAYYLSQVPGAFAMVGAGFTDKEAFPHHHPMFDFNEDSLKIGTEMFINFALSYLS